MRAWRTWLYGCGRSRKQSARCGIDISGGGIEFVCSWIAPLNDPSLLRRPLSHAAPDRPSYHRSMLRATDLEHGSRVKSWQSVALVHGLLDGRFHLFVQFLTHRLECFIDLSLHLFADRLESLVDLPLKLLSDRF